MNDFEKGIKDANLRRFNNVNQIKIEGIENKVVENFEKGLLTELEFGAAFEEIDILKGGKRAVIGEQRMFAGRLHVKTQDGWKFVGKGKGTKAQEHVSKHVSKSQDPDDDGTHTQIDGQGSKIWKSEKGEKHRDGDKPAIIKADGTKYWYKNGRLHREDDKPAAENADGSKEWYKKGQLHRDGDQPAITKADGGKSWVKNGLFHRDGDQPAIIGEGEKYKYWFQNGVRHRDGDKPAAINEDGAKLYFKNGKRYDPKEKEARDDDDDGTHTHEYSGTKSWRNSKEQKHREGDKPAQIDPNGDKSWWKNGKHIRTEKA